MRATRTAAVLGTLALGSALLIGCTDDGERRTNGCEAVEADFDFASPSREDDERFQLDGPGWIGGDSTYSVELPEGRTLWLFSDSFIGTVTSSGDPQPGMAMVHNALVTEDQSGRLSTRTAEGPESFFTDPSDTSYYWVQDAQVEGEELIVFLSRTKDVGDNEFEWERNAIARVSLPDLTVKDIDEDDSGEPVAWGAGLMSTPTHTYIYGIDDQGGTKHLHLARAAAGNLATPSRWEYRTEDGWSDEASDSERLTDGVANELSVSPYEDGYLMISSDTSEPFSPDINAWTACDPEGPWEHPQTIYETPESAPKDHFTYNAHGHPELSEDGELLISYNVNTFNFDELMGDPTLYRPKFITLDLD